MAKKKLPVASVLIRMSGEDAKALSDIAKALSKKNGKKVHRTDLMREGYGLIINLHRKP